ncbi:MAG TPA: 50S ribosomal protein L6 [Candidatus Babeliaceae bacterium]|nr:50S ribosomal protein L6 [Candidatus Babeliaceae bacterium]
MSKIGRRPIDLGNVRIEIKGQEIHYTGKKATGVHILPPELKAVLEGNQLKLIAVEINPKTNQLWGLNRALLFNKIKGADQGLDKQLRIVGLGYKAVANGNILQLSLGFSHKIDYELPKEVAVEIDKTGQLLTFRSSDKKLLGDVCSRIREFRPPEPYKGTGIQYVGEVILRKAGKAKSS